jgi:hypothetical protein
MFVIPGRRCRSGELIRAQAGESANLEVQANDEADRPALPVQLAMSF